ncbi:hypothetical protein CRE_00069 [Caenorhabditis remanei]|uniref:Uncharacterized protein n=1 Tax=Caenorhabditis remanei TaxID=31234 RepID=E3LCW5_CAERE|nr:hypothetical protein CRE_00069 [Caenorhabditis remanei]
MFRSVPKRLTRKPYVFLYSLLRNHDFKYPSSHHRWENEEEVDEVDEPRMFFSPQEKWFLVTFTILVLISLLFTSLAIMVDKHAITGTAKDPSTCMLTDSSDCRTVYTNDAARKIVEVSVRVDLYLSIIAFVTSVVLT